MCFKKALKKCQKITCFFRKTVDFKEKCITIIVIGSRFEFTYFFDFYENENNSNDKSTTVIKGLMRVHKKKLQTKQTTIM